MLKENCKPVAISVPGPAAQSQQEIVVDVESHEGLTDERAAELRKEHGFNQIPEKKVHPLLQV